MQRRRGFPPGPHRLPSRRDGRPTSAYVDGRGTVIAWAMARRLTGNAPRRVIVYSFSIRRRWWAGCLRECMYRPTDARVTSGVAPACSCPLGRARLAACSRHSPQRCGAWPRAVAGCMRSGRAVHWPGRSAATGAGWYGAAAPHRAPRVHGRASTRQSRAQTPPHRTVAAPTARTCAQHSDHDKRVMPVTRRGGARTTSWRPTGWRTRAPCPLQRECVCVCVCVCAAAPQPQPAASQHDAVVTYSVSCLFQAPSKFGAD
jgi:hypothetical protein